MTNLRKAAFSIRDVLRKRKGVLKTEVVDKEITMSGRKVEWEIRSINLCFKRQAKAFTGLQPKPATKKPATKVPIMAIKTNPKITM